VSILPRPPAPLVNYGTISVTSPSAPGPPYRWRQCHERPNQLCRALIEGGASGVKIAGGPGTVVNYGTIAGTGAYSEVVYLYGAAAA